MMEEVKGWRRSIFSMLNVSGAGADEGGEGGGGGGRGGGGGGGGGEST